MNMKLSFRWYGDTDPVTLENISQIPGMRSVVSAVYDVKPGEVWSTESLKKMKNDCENHGLIFDVVESIPVHEDIKLGRGDIEKLLDVYCENIRRCAQYGVNALLTILCLCLTGHALNLIKKHPTVRQVLLCIGIK